MNAINLQTITSKVQQHIRLNDADALWLFEHADLAGLGSLANQVNLNKNGKAVFYNVNRHINPTNICALSCKFCAYSKKIGEAGGYAYEIDEMITKAGEAIAQGATELHMVGGLHPRWGFQRYVDMIAAMRKAYPTIHLKAFTAVELDWMARKARKTVAEVIQDLRDAGLDSFPGGGAEIFHAEVRDAICDTKVSGDQWIDIHRTAHKLGMRSNCTMLYGHIERYEHRVDHLRRLRELQDETHGFNVFIPLSFQPFQNEMGIHRYTFGSDDLRTIAVARLYLDNFKHIKSYWVMLGQDVAQLALNFGANDLDGTVLEEKISRAAGGRSGMIMTRKNLESLIRRSGRIPVERTTLYEPIRGEDRAYLQPVFSDDNSVAADLLRRVKDEDCLSSQETWQLATTASLMQLTDAVREKTSGSRALQFVEAVAIDVSEMTEHKDNINGWLRMKIAEATAGSLAENPHGVSLVLSQIDPVDLPLRDMIEHIRTAAPQAAIMIQGIYNLHKNHKDSGLKISEYLSELRNLGLRGLEATTEDIRKFKQGELDGLYTAAIATDLHISACLSLQMKDDQSPDWSQFCEDLIHLRSFESTIAKCLTVNLIAEKNAGTVMPSEYMAALALTRLTLGTSARICTPLQGLPTLAPAQGLGADITQNPVMKVVSTLSIFGSDGVGIVSLGNFQMDRVYEDLRASGVSPALTNIDLVAVPLRGDKARELQKIRHTPNLSTTPVA